MSGHRLVPAGGFERRKKKRRKQAKKEKDAIDESQHGSETVFFGALGCVFSALICVRKSGKGVQFISSETSLVYRSFCFLLEAEDA